MPVAAPAPRRGPDSSVVGVVVAPAGSPLAGWVAVAGAGESDPAVVGAWTDVRGRLATLEANEHPRWAWWAAAHTAGPFVADGIPVARCWDVAEVHRLQHGGWAATPDLAWAAATGLDLEGRPTGPTGDLFEFAAPADPTDHGDAALTPTGYLRPEAVAGSWLTTPERLLTWARTVADCATRQRDRFAGAPARALATAYSESAAALLCVELEHDGLPIDRAEVVRLIAAAAGPRPRDEAQARAIRRARDAQVLTHLPPGRTADLRSPVSVRDMLAGVGIVVPSTRKWVIDAYRDTHPVVPALLAWRADERIATTYGYAWLDAHIGPDDRLRGGWTACDGAAGRMTAQNGLHNLPAALRPAVAAHEGHVFVRADLGQIEPRVLAAVSGDEAFAAASRADDLYAPVAERLHVERAVAKVAVLAAMYGQRSGAAGEALAGLERAYPTAMRLLDRAYAAGLQAAPIRTFGGRVVRTDWSIAAHPVGAEPAVDASRGRFARNAIIQGSAAELFKAWAATVRATTRGTGAQIVLCLHDELLIHVPTRHADQVVAAVDQALTDAARRWTGSDRVRFVADTSVIARWSDAKH